MLATIRVDSQFKPCVYGTFSGNVVWLWILLYTYIILLTHDQILHVHLINIFQKLYTKINFLHTYDAKINSDGQISSANTKISESCMVPISAKSTCTNLWLNLACRCSALYIRLLIIVVCTLQFLLLSTTNQLSAMVH